VQRKHFATDAPLIATHDGALAFVPPALPPRLDLPAPTVADLDRASHAVGELAGVGRLVRNPRLLIAPYVRREAVLSSRIEGTRSTLADVYAAEAGQDRLFATSDVGEVVNYVRALEHGLASPLPLSTCLILELHRILMTGVRGVDHRPGAFRESQNWVGPPGAGIHEATYVPPPVVPMREALDLLERFMHDTAQPPLVHAALVHYQFEAIHPFLDGNGRVGRLLIPLLLRERGVLPQPLLYVSAAFERERDEYYERLLRVSTHEDWDGWLRFFLAAVTSQAREAVSDADRLLALEAGYRERLRGSRAGATAQALVDHLFENPYLTARRAVEVLSVTDPTARKAIATLEDNGILREVTGRDYGRRWLAEDVLNAIRGGGGA